MKWFLINFRLDCTVFKGLFRRKVASAASVFTRVCTVSCCWYRTNERDTPRSWRGGNMRWGKYMDKQHKRASITSKNATPLGLNISYFCCYPKLLFCNPVVGTGELRLSLRIRPFSFIRKNESGLERASNEQQANKQKRRPRQGAIKA